MNRICSSLPESPLALSARPSKGLTQICVAGHIVFTLDEEKDKPTTFLLSYRLH